MIRLLIIFLLVSATLFAQQSNPLIAFEQEDSLHKYSIQLNTKYAIGSNCLTNELYQTIYQGGYISNDLKSRVNSKLLNNNRMGGDIVNSIFFSQQFDSLWGQKNIGYFVGISDNIHLDAGFSRDLFTLTAYGNSPFMGTTATFDNSSINFVKYQQLKLGIVTHERSNNKSVTYGIALSYLNGQNNLTFLAPTGRLYTSAIADSLSLEANGIFTQSNQANIKWGSRNGTGACFDFFYQSKSAKNSISCWASNLGFIQWNDKSSVYFTDSTYSFTGIEVNTIATIKDSLLQSINKDTLLKNNVGAYKKGYNYTLPGIIQLEYKRIIIPNRTELMAGGNLRIQANYKPLVYVGGVFYLAKKVSLSPTLAYGGYTNFSMGLHLKVEFPYFIFMTLGSNNFDAYLQKQNSTAQGIYFSLQKAF